MKASFVRLALATTMMMPFAPAMAADIDLPPIRPSIIALGIIGGVNALDGDYDFGADPEMSGTNWGLGVRAAYDYYGEGGWAVGIVGDWMWGLGELADNVDPVGIHLSRHELPCHAASTRWLGRGQHAALRNGWPCRCTDGVRRSRRIRSLSRRQRQTVDLRLDHRHRHRICRDRELRGWTRVSLHSTRRYQNTRSTIRSRVKAAISK